MILEQSAEITSLSFSDCADGEWSGLELGRAGKFPKDKLETAKQKQNTMQLKVRKVS